MATKIIKFNNGTDTYVPVTVASAVQYSYGGGVMSVQDAIGTIATTVVSSNHSISDEIKDHELSKDYLSYNSTDGFKLSGTHGVGNVKMVPGTGVSFSYTAGSELKISATNSHASGSDNQHLSASNVTTNKIDVSLDGSGGKVTFEGHKPNAATSTYAYVGLSYTANGSVLIKVSYTDTKPASANLTVAGDTGSQTAFNSNESTAKTLNIKGAAGTPIETAVASGVNVTINHKDSGVTAGKYGTNSDTTITVAPNSSESIIIPEFTVNSYGHVTQAQDQTLTFDFSALTSAMHWVGLSTTDPKGSSGATFSGHTTWLKGDVVTYNSKEYVLSGDSNAAANWLELGDEGSHALKGTTTCAPGEGLTGTTMYAYVTGSNGTIKHANQNNAAEVSGNKLTASGGTAADSVNVITAIKRDAYGHVVGIESGKTQNTHSSSKNVICNSNTGTTQTTSQLTNGNVYLNHIESVGSTNPTSTLKIVGTGTVSAYTNANGSQLTIYSAAPAADIDIKTLQGGTNVTTYEAVAAGTGSATATGNDDTITLTGANYWINVNAGTKNVNIAHALSSSGEKTSADVYAIKIDKAGHITEATAAQTGTVGISSLKYKVGNEVDDINDAALGLTFGSNIDIAELTGDKTFVK